MSQDLWRERHMNPPGTEMEWLDREHTCHDRCPCQLRERIARAIAAAEGYDVDDSLWRHLANDLRAEFEHHADAALSVVRPELDRKKDAIHAWSKALAEAGEVIGQLRSELADMTTQRDKLHESVVHLGQKVGEVSYERNEARRRAEAAEADAALYLKERDEALTERDDAIRSADAAAAERERETERCETLETLNEVHITAEAKYHRERDEARWERDGKQAQLDSLEQKLTQTNAERDQAWAELDQLQGQVDTALIALRTVPPADDSSAMGCGEEAPSGMRCTREHDHLSRGGWHAAQDADGDTIVAWPADDGSEACQCQNCQPVPPGLNPMGED